MFKNVIIYSVLTDPAFNLQMLTDMAETSPFEPTGLTQKISYGWQAPRGPEAEMVEFIDGQYLLRFRQETRTVPAVNLMKALNEACQQYERANGYLPGKKLRKELREEVELSLLPTGVLAQKSVWVWIDRENQRIYLDTPSQSVADTISTLLVEGIKGLSLGLLRTKRSAQGAMAQWLLEQEPPVGFTIDRYLELKAADESKAGVRYTNHPLDTDEVREHIRGGKFPVACEFTFDDRISFRLIDPHRLTKIKCLDAATDNASKKHDDDDDALSVDMTLATGEIKPMVEALIESLDGLDDIEIIGTREKPKSSNGDGAPWDDDNEDDDDFESDDDEDDDDYDDDDL